MTMLPWSRRDLLRAFAAAPLLACTRSAEQTGPDASGAMDPDASADADPDAPPEHEAICPGLPVIDLVADCMRRATA